ncbi:hypothetical protein RDV78_09335 [Bacillota bacterium LX-D]|nr:hypothetical protein [Bacillota bacterium LX-D]
MKVRVNDQIVNKDLQVKLRLDYKGEAHNKFFLKGKSSERAADEVREQRAALLRNVPFQGITINNLDINSEIYTVQDDADGTEIAYAPINLDLSASSIEDLICFIVRDEFRKVEVLEQNEIVLTGQDLERLLFKINFEIRRFRDSLEKKYNSK